MTKEQVQKLSELRERRDGIQKLIASINKSFKEVADMLKELENVTK